MNSMLGGINDMCMRVRLIVVPYDMGTYNNGHGRGPKALIDACWLVCSTKQAIG